MGWQARLNPRSYEGHKEAGHVERARLEVAPLTVLVQTLVRLLREKWRG